MSGPVVHFEVPAENIERARKFYQQTFAWQMQEMPGMEYTLVATTPGDKDGRPLHPGAINGGIAKRAGPLQHPVITIMVEEIDTALQAVEKNGGKTLVKKMPIGDGTVGHSAYIRDSEGNTIGLFQRGKM